jgi:GGDEF domain-containing protein
MTTARNHLTLATSAAATPAVDDVTCLLPTREALLDQLDERLPLAQTQPVTLFIVGLLRRDDGRSVAQSTLAQVTSLLARSLRGEDWLGSSGPAEFAVVLSGGETAAKTAAERLVRAVAALEIPDLSATAGIAALSTDLTAGEVFRRATLSLTSARRVGAGTVIRYREPLA